MSIERPKEVDALFDKLREILRENNVSPDKYAVFGSGPMGIRGLHVINDVDVIVTNDLFAQLESRYGSEYHEHGIRWILLHGGEIEILNGWYPMIAPLEDLIADAEEIEGLKFVRLERVLEWKRKRGKPKDPGHVEVIEEYLASK